ncbi:MAG: diguanylate cyclase [Actinomycetes bacterium]
MIELSSSSWTRAGLLKAWQTAVVVGFAFLVAHLTLGLGGPRLDHFVDWWVYDTLEVLAAGGCFLRSVWVEEERLAWGILGAGILSFAIGDICYDFVYGGEAPVPSVCDAFFLGLYPCAYASLALLVKSRVSKFSPSIALDGVIAALAVGAVSAAVVVQVVLNSTSGSKSLVLVSLAYPLGDLVLLALVVFVFAITGWRPGRAWATVGAAFALFAVGDSVYLYACATGTYSEGTLLDATWPAALLLLAAFAWQTHERDFHFDLEGRFLGATPIGFGLVGVGVLIVSRAEHLNVLAVALGALTVLTVFARTALSFRENAVLYADARQQSLSDSLTGLANRRKLVSDLERAIEAAQTRPSVLVIFDLNGFKQYNDTLGHPGGDALLVRLAHKLSVASAAHGETYRLGGDEFCLLAYVERDQADAVIDAAIAALEESGEGFSISSSFGAAYLPGEATDASGALRVADQRLYAQKAQLQRGRGDSYELLLRALSEREPALREHVQGFADLSLAVGRLLGLRDDDLEELRLAAELHDVGKLGIPDEVLAKPRSLGHEEWEFIRQHTVIGQRILNGAPALRGVGEIVRATHERWDGSGYVDGLAGSDIPIAARIIAVCDTYSAMTSVRPYRSAVSHEEAVEEIERCAGTQFDPVVVRAFMAVRTPALV